MRREAEQTARKAKAAAKTRKGASAQRCPGRPQGSRNPPKAPVTLTPELVRSKAMIDALLQLIAGGFPLTSLVLEGPCGHHNALHRARQNHWHLIAKLRCDAALYFPSTGSSAGRGPRRK